VLTPARRQCGGDPQNANDVGAGAAGGGGGVGRLDEDLLAQQDEVDDEDDEVTSERACNRATGLPALKEDLTAANLTRCILVSKRRQTAS
jgi:hypothetical protein